MAKGGTIIISGMYTDVQFELKQDTVQCKILKRPQGREPR